ncbi:MAG TPA: ABC-ATPase domain-containing protein [Vicinamibacteria bacterium]|nr:ABC-ATPase domain-containing protein [Vicinamibacteria bacterium]
MRAILARIDGRGYKEYRALSGSHSLSGATIFIDHVQRDPYASPSKLRLRVAGRIPEELIASSVRRVALQDFLARKVSRIIPSHRRGPRPGTRGLIAIDAGGQEVLERTAVVVTSDFVEARIEVGLPAAGRTILGMEAEHMLLEELPEIAERALRSGTVEEGMPFVQTVENHTHLARQLAARGLVAFVADGSILPRASGSSELPMPNAIPFRSPRSLRVDLGLKHPLDDAQTLSGMGIPEGVTLVVGGGYHGKSTLLKALERGVYPHVPGDGREYVVTRPDAVKIRAEDGRSVAGVDISSFVRELPIGRSTDAFSSEDASGSTSQAASIIEAIEVGAKVLMLDEDTSATNLMFRDARMQALVARDGEPIVPFVDRLRELKDGLSVSTVLVTGSSGDSFESADTVIRMKDYSPEDVTAEAVRVAKTHPTGRAIETPSPFARSPGRHPLRESIDASRGRREVRIDARGRDSLAFGEEHIDLRAVEQLVDASQTRAIGFAIRLAAERFLTDDATMGDLVERLEELFDREGLDVLSPFNRPGEHPGNFARPRRFETAAVLNRIRSLRIGPR